MSDEKESPVFEMSKCPVLESHHVTTGDMDGLGEFVTIHNYNDESSNYKRTWPGERVLVVRKDDLQELIVNLQKVCDELHDNTDE